MHVGINHNRKIVTFGCALGDHEMESSYIGVLEQLVEAGDGQRSKVTVTNCDKAMANAIRAVFPKAQCRLCLWHFNEKCAIK